MSATDLVMQFIELLDRLSIAYMLVGSYSSNYFGRPRSTEDADFVVLLGAGQLELVRQGLGVDFELDAQMSFESVTMTTRYVVTHRTTAFKLELFLLSDDAHDQARFGRRRQVSFEGRVAWLPTAEDVVVQKLRWFAGSGRAKDLEDVRAVVQLQRATLDLAYVRHWTGLHGTRERFESLLAE